MSAESKFKLQLRKLCILLISEYPFYNAVSFLLLLAERSKSESHPPWNPYLIYTHLGLMIFCGVAMLFNIKRKEAAVLHAGQLFYLIVSTYDNDKLNYKTWLKVRICSRILGVAAQYLLFAHFVTESERRHSSRTTQQTTASFLHRAGTLLFGIYLMMTSYSLVESRDERDAFTSSLPAGLSPLASVLLYAVVLTHLACCLCYLADMFVNDVTHALVLAHVLLLLMVEARSDWWVRRRGLHSWVYWRCVGDCLLILVGLVLYLCCTKKRVYDSSHPEYEGRIHSD